MADNNLRSKYFLLFFLLVSLVDIIAILNDNTLWQTISKPLIIPALMFYYVARSKARNKWYILALIFSFLGDVLLLDKSNLFLFGIGAFLMTQLLYVYIFSKGLSKSSWRKRILAFLPFLIFFFALIQVLKPGLNGFFVPVVIYGVAISIFGAISLLKHLVNKDSASLSLISGALLFILSDSMIALHKFHESRSIYPVAIMLTYILAQYLIAMFMLKSENGELLEEAS